MQEKTTGALEQELSSCATFRDFVRDHPDIDRPMALHEQLELALKTSGMRRAEVLQRSGLNTIYGYRVLSGKRRPSRDVLLCLCLGLRMQPEQVQTLLKSTGYAPLYVKNRRDSAIYYALSHGQDAVTLNQMLFDLEEATLL